MLEFHSNPQQYFDIQLHNAEKNVLPFIDAHLPNKEGRQLLEIGCGMGSVLSAFASKGWQCIGVEMYEPSLDNARHFLKPEIAEGSVKLVAKDIYKCDPEKDFGTRFDLIVLKDVIEHIHDQQKLIAWMKLFLKPGGMIFFGFPPWQMPYGGHQQVAASKVLSKLPYFHLLPMPLYKLTLKAFGENPEAFVEIKETGISIEKFQRIIQDTGYKIVAKTHWLINPVYEFKFGWKARKQFAPISQLPWLRNFLTTAVYYLVQPA